MNRGDLFRVSHPSLRDPKRSRVFVVVSRQILIEYNFSTVICAPVYTRYDGLSTQIVFKPILIPNGIFEKLVPCEAIIKIIILQKQ